jgi:uncharacterized surface protein with fasciclin (FAS1) repeats
MSDILNIIKSSTELEIFATAIQLAHLDRVLERSGNFTVFAPVDAAFTSLSTPKLQQLSRDVSLLSALLKVHIADGCLKYEELLRMSDRGHRKLGYIALDGSFQPIDLSEGMKIGIATVRSIDPSPTNGIIYRVDRLMLGSDEQSLDRYRNPDSTLIA